MLAIVYFLAFLSESPDF